MIAYIHSINPRDWYHLMLNLTLNSIMVHLHAKTCFWLFNIPQRLKQIAQRLKQIECHYEIDLPVITHRRPCQSELI